MSIHKKFVYDFTQIMEYYNTYMQIFTDMEWAL